MTLLALIGGFLLFMATIGAAHALDRYGERRYGYLPFALPNLAFMLIPHGLLSVLLVQANGVPAAPGVEVFSGPGFWVSALAAAGASLGMFVIVRARTGGWLALVATVAMLFAASVLLFSVLFRAIAGGRGSEGRAS